MTAATIFSAIHLLSCPIGDELQMCRCAQFRSPVNLLLQPIAWVLLDERTIVCSPFYSHFRFAHLIKFPNPASQTSTEEAHGRSSTMQEDSRNLQEESRGNPSRYVTLSDDPGTCAETGTEISANVKTGESSSGRVAVILPRRRTPSSRRRQQRCWY